MEYSQQLRNLIEREDILICPGTHNAISARIFERMGYECLAISGAGLSYGLLGFPNVQYITMDEMVKNSSYIQQRVDLPVIGDAENGWGDVHNVKRTVEQFSESNISGVHIEDTAFPYLYYDEFRDDSVIPRSDAVNRIRVATDTRDRLKSNMLISARTDANKVSDKSLDEAITRANEFLEAGADMVYVAGLVNREEVEEVPKRVDGPVQISAHYLEFQYSGPGELADLGYNVVVYPMLSIQASFRGIIQETEAFTKNPSDAYEKLTNDSQGSLIGGLDSVIGKDDIIELLDEYR